MSNGKGPPDKWADFQSDGMTSAEVLNQLNQLAQQGYLGPVIYLQCEDGGYVFVGGYTH
jgi:hypothetical protein